MRLVLVTVGIATLIAWYVPWQSPGWYTYVGEFGGFPFGLSWEWYTRLEHVTLALGLVALLAALLRFRVVHGVAALALAAGAIFLAPWVLDPPLGIGYRWPAYVAVAAPAIGALAAAWLTLRGAATDGPRAPARVLRRSPRPHSPTPPR